jgi:ribosomal protein L11 methyltransferase
VCLSRKIKGVNSFVVNISPPASLLPKSRDVLSQVLVRLGERFGLQGMEDWSVDIPGSTKFLAVAHEFMDLSGMRKEAQAFVLYFENKSRALDFSKLVQATLPELKVAKPEKAKLVDWVARWRKYYKPQRICANQHCPTLWVLPVWISKKLLPNQLQIKIDPGQAFGTGTHPTTQSCLEFFLGLTHRQLPKDKAIAVLDFGAGTGILAMAAAQWAKSKKQKYLLDCIEIDPTARGQLKKNLALNRVDARVHSKCVGKKQYDIVFANVLAPVLLQEQVRLWRMVKAGGVLILSGILAAEAHPFLNQFLPGKKRRQLGLRVMGDWAAVLMEKP